MNLKKTNKVSAKLGLTLIETLVAISVLMVAVSGAITLANQSLRSSSVSKDQITASYLAEEGMESVKNIRDSNFLRGASALWLDGLGPCNSGNGCKIDSNDVNPTASACGGGCVQMTYDPATGRYGHNTSWQNSAFIRKIEVKPAAGGNSQEMLVTVTVSWTHALITHSFSLKETIYEWYQ